MHLGGPIQGPPRVLLIFFPMNVSCEIGSGVAEGVYILITGEQEELVLFGDSHPALF